jgi:hypothetical protein
LAEITALFHDIGRFEQIRCYGTFSDLKSEDHALLGIKVLRQNHVLDDMDDETTKLILSAIEYHNRLVLPERETEQCLFFIKLLRDADKLDILRVVTDNYRNHKESRNETVNLDLPDTPEISDNIYEDLMNERMAKMIHMKTLNDFKLIQIGWIYDINFPRTFELINERQYFQIIFDVLPESDKTSMIYSKIQNYINNMNT